jgi:hypothetical protein
MDPLSNDARQSSANQEKEDTRPSFAAHLKSHIEPHFKDLELERMSLAKDLTKRRTIVGTGVGGLGIGGIIGAVTGTMPDLGPDTLQFGLMGLGLAAMGGFAWSEGPKRAFHKLYKTRIIPEVASFFGTFDYNPSGRLSMSRLRPSKLIPSHDRYRSEDLFRGTYKDVGVEFCEAKLTDTRGSGKNRRTVTVFNGVFVLLEMNKPFSGKIIVRKDAGAIGNWFRNTFSGKMERVALEDPEFERRFEVYSDDQVAARYLLTPAFMSRLDDLAKAVNAKGMQAAFYDSKLMVMLSHGGSLLSNLKVGGFNFGNVGTSSKNMFEPGSIYAPLTSTGDIERISAEFKSILDVVDRLQLDQKTRV